MKITMPHSSPPASEAPWGGAQKSMFLQVLQEILIQNQVEDPLVYCIVSLRGWGRRMNSSWSLFLDHFIR